MGAASRERPADSTEAASSTWPSSSVQTRARLKQTFGPIFADAPHLTWSLVDSSRESRSVSLFYVAYIDGKACPQVRQARIEEADDWVCIQLLLSPPDDPRYACPLAANPTATTVRLTRELGDRTLLLPPPHIWPRPDWPE